MDKVHARIKRVLANLGNRIYELQFENGEDSVIASFAILDFGEFNEEKQFFQIGENSMAFVNIHRCPNLMEYKDVYYVWQGRLKGRLPTACPHCHYRLDNKPMRGV